jgi:hypothetical protein
VGLKIIIPTGTIHLPFQDHALSSYERILPPQPPSHLLVNASAETCDSKLIITWDACDDCDGYFLERSVGTMDSFKLLTILDPGKFKYNNDGLDNHTTYYYRMYSYNFAGPSGFSTTAAGYTHTVGIHETGAKLDFQIFPNPVRDYLHLKLPETNPGAVSVYMYDFSGKQVLCLTPEALNEEYTIPVSHLPAGIYLVRLQSRDAVYNRKVIIE